MGFAFVPIGIGSLAGGRFGGFLIHRFGEVLHQPRLIWWGYLEWAWRRPGGSGFMTDGYGGTQDLSAILLIGQIAHPGVDRRHFVHRYRETPIATPILRDW